MVATRSAAKAAKQEKRVGNAARDYIAPVNPLVDNGITLLLFVLTYLLINSFFNVSELMAKSHATSGVYDPLVLYGAEIPLPAQHWQFLFIFIGAAVFVEGSKRVGRWFGLFVSRTFLNKAPFDNPLGGKKKKKVLKKWTDQSWQFSIHVTMTVWECRLLWPTTWLSDPSTMWDLCPLASNFHASPELRLFYFTQLAIWMYTAYSHRFVEERRRDYVVMYLHHVVTIALVLFSHLYNQQRIGMLVLFLHDASDITVDLLKLFNYLKLEDRAGFFLVEFIFVANLLSWCYFRLFLYPTRALWSAWRDSADMCGGVVGDEPRETMVWREVAGVNMWPEQAVHGIIHWQYQVGMLCVLQALHVWWFCLFLRLGYFVLKGTSHEGGAHEYEGGSDDEDDDDSDEDDRKKRQ